VQKKPCDTRLHARAKYSAGVLNEGSLVELLAVANHTRTQMAAPVCFKTEGLMVRSATVIYADCCSADTKRIACDRRRAGVVREPAGRET
jgi:hypothetical protein